MDGLVLAGGRGSRMQAQDARTRADAEAPIDKGLVPLAGRPLVAHVVHTLRPQVDELFISINTDRAAYAQWGRCILDRADGQGAIPYDGPLAGVLAGLDASGAEWLAVAPCDSPFLPQDWATTLLNCAMQSGAPLAVARHREDRHPVCMVLQRDLRENLDHYLAAGGRKVGAWQHAVHAAQVDFDGCAAHAFMNINSPADLVQAEACIGQLPGAQPSQRDNS